MNRWTRKEKEWLQSFVEDGLVTGKLLSDLLISASEELNRSLEDVLKYWFTPNKYIESTVNSILSKYETRIDDLEQALEESDLERNRLDKLTRLILKENDNLKDTIEKLRNENRSLRATIQEDLNANKDKSKENLNKTLKFKMNKNGNLETIE